MTTLLDKYADKLAELLDEKHPLQHALDVIEERATGEDIVLDDILRYFKEVYEAIPEEYAENVDDDSKWALTNDLGGVHFEDELEEQMLDEEFDKISI